MASSSLKKVSKNVTLSSFEDWNPIDYLKDYYSHVEQDERYTIEFLVNEFKKIQNKPVAVEFGAGPTLHHVIPLAPYVSEIHMTDYLMSNLHELTKWQKLKRGSHNWNEFTKFTLGCEGKVNVTEGEIAERESLVRKKITKYFLSDASKQNPLGEKLRETYEFVLSCYCADSATDSREVWYEYMKNIVSLLKPGGFFVTTALRNCQHYRVGERFFPCAYVNEQDFKMLLQDLDFNMSTVSIIVKNVPEHKEVGYESIVLVSGFKNK